MSYNFRDAMKKQLAREQAEAQEEVVVPEAGAEATLEPTFTADEITEMEEVKAQEAEVDSLAEGNELVDQIQDRIEANNEIIEGEAEPTEAQVVQAVGEAKHFAYLTAKIDNFVTESIDFMVNGQRYALATESFSFSAKGRREQLKDVNLALEGIVASIANGLKDFIKKVIETIKNIAKTITGLFSKRARIVNFAEKNKSQIMAMYKDVNGIIEVTNSFTEEQRNKLSNKIYKNHVELFKNLIYIEASCDYVFSNKKGSPEEIKKEYLSNINVEEALKDVSSILPLLLKAIKDSDDRIKNYTNDLNTLEKLSFSLLSKALFKGEVLDEAAEQLIRKNFKHDIKELDPKEICQWYGKEFPSIIAAYNAVKPNLIDQYTKGINGLFGTVTNVISKVTDNKIVTALNEFFNGTKTMISALKNISNSLYYEIETCVQVYQMYNKSKSQGENK